MLIQQEPVPSGTGFCFYFLICKPHILTTTIQVMNYPTGISKAQNNEKTGFIDSFLLFYFRAKRTDENAILLS